MEQPIVIRYRWTLEEHLQGYRYFYRFTCRPWIRYCIHFLLGIMLVGGIWSIAYNGSGDKQPLVNSLALALPGIYWFAIRPFHFPWSLRRKFAKHPDKNLDIEWQANDDQLSRSAQWRTVFRWEMFRMIVCTPKGVLLYFPTGSFFWLPRHGFSSDVAFECFLAVAKGKLHGFYHVP